MPLSPKFKINLAKVIPFAVIWVFTGCIFLFVEMAATGYENPDPTSAIDLTLPVFLFAMLAVAVVGMLVGFMELIYFERKFRNQSFARKITLKFIIYTGLTLVILSITYPIAASLELGVSVFDQAVFEKFGRFMTSMTLISTLVQLAFSLLLSLFYAAISENLGPTVLYNFFTGKYHQPREELRIFMFLDMKSSTTIAEQLGHIRYFELLQKYYDTMTDTIINHFGEVYQYIGDEVVISWPMKNGLKDANCLRCFFAMKAAFAKAQQSYHRQFGVLPDFKAGLHCGPVTAGEIGATKKEIVFSGDVLNTTARIQALCNQYEQDLIISKDLKDNMPDEGAFIFNTLGEIELRGKNQSIELFGVDFTPK